ncbi:MAG: hypothetical protein VXY93_22500, partial [Pseudomonadota bacterium]|nr:hypothetical protein [Pseudomonadota bacterium]
PAALAFYTSPNVDTSANSGRGDITERLRITSRGDMRFGSSSIANKINSLDYILTFTGRGGGGAGAIAFRSVNGQDAAFINVENSNVFITADPSNAMVDSSIRFRVDGSNERLNITPSGINVSGIVTATGADINGDLDVDGHTNLDNVNIAGVTTMGQTTIFTTGGTTLL